MDESDHRLETKSSNWTRPVIRASPVIRALEDWGKLIGDVPAATAILDRFLHNAEVIAITGRSYRLRNRAAGEDNAAGAKSKGRRSTGGDESHSPPEDTNASVAVSSVGGGQPAKT